jgi:hypothetical protein
MGSGFDEAGRMAFCDGKDVLKRLNDVFGDPNSKAFQQAQAAKDEFAAVPNGDNNYLALIKAYNAAGVSVSVTDPWGLYLKLLGTAQPQGPDNISAIAQIRYDGLNNSVAMETIVHMPKHGGHVHTRRGSKAGLSSQIDSPCPMPGTVGGSE